ncbi:MAG: hypothetical protein H6825_16205 [Planctomycetes bacterium]|nr:hypothetical protein [Planctomycetota bacterium]
MTQETRRHSPPEDVAAGAPVIDRRRGGDRRAQPTAPISRFFLFGRRIRGRRRGERSNLYVDRYTKSEWMLALGILVMSLTDLVLTLQYLDMGGEEANPFMRWALASGQDSFVTWKLALTLAGAVFLLVHARFRGVRFALTGLFAMYVALLGYHAVLRISLAG